MPPTTSPACAPVREALSARLDDEDAVLPADEVDHHLAACTACRRFATALPAVNRRVTVGGADAVPDLTAPILVALAADGAGTPDRRVLDLRVVVALAGVVQLVLAVPVLLGTTTAFTHVGRDLGAVELALGVGLLLAAIQPRRAAGVLPIAAVAAAVATVGGVIDLVTGRASVLAELTHLTEVVGVLALWALTRRLPSERHLVPVDAV